LFYINFRTHWKCSNYIIIRLSLLVYKFLLIFCFNFQHWQFWSRYWRFFCDAAWNTLYLSLPVRVLLRASLSGVELQPRCRKARCNYQDVATWMIGYIVDAIGISITNMSFAILECCSRYRSCGKKITSSRAKTLEGDAMPRFIGVVRSRDASRASSHAEQRRNK